MQQVPTFHFQKLPSRKLLVLRLILVLVLYFVTGKLGLSFPFIPPSITLIWLPTGIALAAFVRWGNAMLPAVWTAAFLVNYLNQTPFVASTFIAIGNTLAPFAVALYLRHTHFSHSFVRREDVIRFVLASAIGMSISASIGSLSLSQLGVIAQPKLAWISWWAGDTVGIFLAAPFLFSLSQLKHKFKYALEENLIFLAIFIATHWLIFFSKNSLLQLTFIAMAVMFWAAMRLGNVISALTVLASSAVAAIATHQGFGPFKSLEASESSIVLWLYMATLSITSLLITTLQAERIAATQELSEAFERISKVASRLPGVIMQYRIQVDRSTSLLYASDAIASMFEVEAKEIRNDAS
ncbi:MAG: MASE1 domain-containing protein, partial [Burkholderiales bacterium]|nr:MASE1 domain-containing protein [Burkholderiales bacterium]